MYSGPGRPLVTTEVRCFSCQCLDIKKYGLTKVDKTVGKREGVGGGGIRIQAQLYSPLQL